MPGSAESWFCGAGVGAVGADAGVGGVRSWGRASTCRAGWLVFRAEKLGYVGARLARGLGAKRQ